MCIRDRCNNIFKPMKVSNAANPVSYTHLDVYKRQQFFKGVVIQLRGTGATKTFTIRKMSGDVGVERVFPINMPALQKIEVDRRGKVRRSRIFYFRDLRGKKARIKDAAYKK